MNQVNASVILGTQEAAVKLVRTESNSVCKQTAILINAIQIFSLVNDSHHVRVEPPVPIMVRGDIHVISTLTAAPLILANMVAHVM